MKQQETVIGFQSGAPRVRSPWVLRASVLAAMLLAGCATRGPSWVDSEKVKAVDEESHKLIADRVAEETAKFAAMQDVLKQNLERVKRLPVAPVEPVFNPLDAVKVTLMVDDADVRYVFKAIADQAKLNLVLPSGLSKKPRTITLNLRNMPASRVFDHVIKTLDLSGKVENGVMVVRELEESVFDLDFLQTATSADFNAGGDVFGANQNAGPQGGSGGASAETGIRNSFNLRGRNINDGDPFVQIEALLQTVFADPDAPAAASSDSRGEKGEKSDKGDKRQMVVNGNVGASRYVLNRSTGTLYVHGKPSQIAAVSRLVSHYKAVLGRQVQIEAQILDIELNDQFQFGVDWNMLKDKVALNYGQNSLALGQLATILPDAINPAQSVTIPSQVLGSAGTPHMGGAYKSGAQNVALNLMKTFGAVHVLSNPSLRVKNTQPAVVSVGSNERFIMQTSSNVSNSGGGQSTVSSNVITGSLFDGVMLGVIPFVTENGEINLVINPVQTKVQPESTNLIDVGSAQNPLKISLPKVDFKGMVTSLSLRDGDMVILGGLIAENGVRSKNGLPGIAEVPFFGEVLGGTNRQANARELVIVLRVKAL
jgi:MSHA type pilus biogenesis protein MshL